MNQDKSGSSVKHLLAIDPSIRYCGIAVYRIENKTAHLKLYDCIRNNVVQGGMVEWMRAAIGNARILEKYIEKADIVVVEEPRQWGMSGKSEVSAKSQSLNKLVTFVGMIISDVDRYGKKYYGFTPNDWKGQLKKDITTARINKYFSLSLDHRTIEHNAADAIGVGLHWLHSYKYKVSQDVM